ncbi:efflux RND transporter periplasmic adaptor subunit [Aquisalibacillus elongatus]|uniref:RND family efflux transporter MFP subunit n=1 Tax=Aquisalibacillus elongatus TaxID=485577 RepID=A0A3N5C739_9BACI|nr:efflux RND transporter periplasmic adaptor subunit [Aquisalibacillus elongatus]RPF54135.1 RND family efflux transporter MFP subunit [Aquisalibacillus elongatus]
MKKFILLVTLLTFAITLVACNEEPEEEETETTAIPVEIDEVVQTDFTETRTFVGRMVPSDQMPVVPEMAGEVDELLVEQGDTVEEGDVLAEIVHPQYGRQELEAPMDGQIEQLNMVEGRAITTENPAAVVVAIDPLNLTFNVPASELSKFSVDDEIDFTVSQLSEEGTATVTSIPSSAGETGTFTIEAEIDNENHSILSGVTAQVLLNVVVEENVLTVPTEAVVEREGGTVVYKVDGEQAAEVPVEVINMQSANTAIEAAEDTSLEEGDSVVVRGQLTLSDGQKISIQEEGQ